MHLKALKLKLTLLMYMEDVLLTLKPHSLKYFFILFSNLATSGNTYTTINPITTTYLKVNINFKSST